MTFTAQQAGKIERHGRSYRLAVEVRAVDSGTTYWCDLAREYGTHAKDKGVQRLLSLPSVRLRSEISSGIFATEPTKLALRNGDSWFDRLGAITLYDDNGVARTIPAWKRARVRLRMIELGNAATSTAYVLGHFYIDKISTSGDIATVTLQPLLRLLQTVTPAAVKQGDRWYRDEPAPRLIRRLVQHAIPDVTISSTRFPVRVTLAASARAIHEAEPNPPRVGPVIDNRGRMPDTVDNVEVPDRDKLVPTALCHDTQTPLLTWNRWLYYATANATGKARVYRTNRLTNDSTLLLDVGVDGRVVCYLEELTTGIGSHLFVGLVSHVKSNWTTAGQRQVWLYRIDKTTGATLSTLLSNAPRWSFCEQFPMLVQSTVGNTWGVGTNIGSDGRGFGELVALGFPQLFEGFLRNSTFGDVVQKYVVPKQKNSMTEFTFNERTDGLLTDGIELNDRGGFQLSFILNGAAYPQHTSGGAVKYHHSPFPRPILYVKVAGVFATLEWDKSTVWDAAGAWKLRTNQPNGTENAAITLQFPNSGFGNQMKQHSPVAWCSVSQALDAVIGSTNWIVLATVDYQSNRAGDAKSQTKLQFWRINLAVAGTTYNAANGGLVLLAEYEPGGPLQDGPWPTVVDMTYAKARDALGSPSIVGCYHDRASNVYRCFTLNLNNNFLNLNLSTDLSRAPISGAPFVGWNAYDGSLYGETRVFFRDCGTGLLWEWGNKTGQFRMAGQARAVDAVNTWEAVPRLAIVHDTDPAETRVFGFAAPTSPLWVRPMDANFVPNVELAGSFRFWELGREVSLRVPVADFREELVRSTQAALDFLAQAAGPGWVYGIDPASGEFFFESFAGVGSTRLVDGLDPEDVADWEDGDVTVYELERTDETGEDVQTHVVVVPWEPTRPAVGGTLEYGPRANGSEPKVAISATASVEGGRRVVLNVTRDGSVGPNDITDVNSYLVGYTPEFETSLLLSWSEDAEDILTELAAPATTYTTIRVRGIAGDGATERTIGGATVRSRSLPFLGDYVQIGESAVGRITGFSDPDTITTEGCGSVPGGSVPAGTSVRIQPARRAGVGADSGYLVLDAATSGALTVRARNADGVHPGNVVRYEQELVLVDAKRALTVAAAPWTHELTITRGYLKSDQVGHAGGPFLCDVFLHPTTTLPQPIGATGLSIAFAADPNALLEERTLQSGDRIVLEYAGVEAERAKFDQSIAEDPEAVTKYGKRSETYDENPYVSGLLAPHLARARLAAFAFQRVPFTCTLPFAPELDLTAAYNLRSKKRLPGETNYTIPVRIRSISHDLARGVTKLELLTIQEAVGAGAGAGGSAGVGTAFGG